jgi:hypothetical protein
MTNRQLALIFRNMKLLCLGLALFGSASAVDNTSEHRRLQAMGCTADINADGMVGVDDLLALLASYGGAGAGDVNGDGAVGVNDLLALLAEYGRACNRADPPLPRRPSLHFTSLPAAAGAWPRRLGF